MSPPQQQPQPQSKRSNNNDQPAQNDNGIGLNNQSAKPSKQSINRNRQPTKRRKVAKACLFCKRSHMTCDDLRPCQRCIKREIGHLCCDEPPNQSNQKSNLQQKQKQVLSHQVHQSSLQLHQQQPTHQFQPQLPIQFQQLSSAAASASQSNSLQNQNLRSDIDPSISGLLNQSQLSLQRPSNSRLTTNRSIPNNPDPATHPIDLSSAFLPSKPLNADNILDLLNRSPQLNQSHLSKSSSPIDKQEEAGLDLDEFLNSYPSLFGNSSSGSSSNNNNNNNSNSNGNRNDSNQTNNHWGNISPSVAAIASSWIKQEEDDNLNNNNNNNNNNSSSISNNGNNSNKLISGIDKVVCSSGNGSKDEDRLDQIIREDGVSVFDYSRSEKFMFDWAEKMASESSKLRLMNLLKESKGLFSSITEQQSINELIESEYQFKKYTIEYVPLLETLPIPGCIWRRTGEIEKSNPQFEELIGLKRSHRNNRSSTKTNINDGGEGGYDCEDGDGDFENEDYDEDEGEGEEEEEEENQLDNRGDLINGSSIFKDNNNNDNGGLGKIKGGLGFGGSSGGGGGGGGKVLEGGKFKIYEIWDEDSNLNYWEKFNRIALDQGQKAVLTSCVLLKQDLKRRRSRGRKNNRGRRRGGGGLGGSEERGTMKDLKGPENVNCSKDEDQDRSNMMMMMMMNKKKKNKKFFAEGEVDEEGEVLKDGLDGKLSDFGSFQGSSRQGEVVSLVKVENSGNGCGGENLKKKNNNNNNNSKSKNKEMEKFRFISCTFSFTVKRDSFGLPSLIVGNFLPS